MCQSILCYFSILGICESFDCGNCSLVTSILRFVINLPVLLQSPSEMSLQWCSILPVVNGVASFTCPLNTGLFAPLAMLNPQGTLKCFTLQVTRKAIISFLDESLFYSPLGELREVVLLPNAFIWQ